MRKLKFNKPIILLLVSILSIAVFTVIAQSQNAETENMQTKDNFENNLNLVRIFRLINSLNKEADNQEKKGFPKRAESVGNYFQKKTGITDEAKQKLNALSATFQKQYKEISNRVKEISKSRQNNPNNASAASELEELRQNQDNLYEFSRQSLRSDLSGNDLERILEFLRENILGKTRNTNKFKTKEELNERLKKGWLSNISYNNTMLYEDEIEGYSFIDFEPATGEVWGTAVTEGQCEFVNQDGEQDYGCRGAFVYAEITFNGGTIIASESADNIGSSADVYVYGTAEEDGEYCISAQHAVETNYEYQMIYADSSDCTDVITQNEETPQIDILWNGNSITDTTQEAVVGQKIELSATVTGGTPSNQQWTIDGEKVKNYVVNCTGATGSNGGTICESPTSGTKVDLLGTDLNQGTVNYYWWKGADGLQVEYSATVNGTPYTASATFNVLSPTSTISAVPNAVTQETRGAVFVDFTNGNWWLYHGEDFPLPPGIQLKHETTFPNGFAGTTQWVQTYNLLHRFQNLDDTWSRAEKVGIDKTYPYPPFDSQRPNEMKDSPNQQLTGFTKDGTLYNWKRVEVTDSATTWVMFKPEISDSIWVPLASVNWSWNAIASKETNGTWVKESSSTLGPTANTTLDFPKWNVNVQHYTITPE